MKKFKYIIISGILALGMTSCQDWLDVNTDPDNPNNESVVISNRLPWMQSFYMYSAGVTNMRTSCTAGIYYSNNSTPNTLGVTWACTTSASTTPYQTWFVRSASNYNDLYNKAKSEGAYHYMAAADVIHALGFMEMLDLYGEMPYTEALGESAAPAYDDGKTIYEGCIAKLDEAIGLFNQTQETGATSFSSGDMWNNGDVSKWLKMCYGLKARYALKLSKKTDRYDPNTILQYLDNAPQSNADNVVGTCYNSSSDVTDALFGDPIMTNANWDYVAYGNYQRISQYYYNLLTNMRESNVIDPRMSKIVPAIMCNIKLDASGNVQSYEWNRSKGVDFYGESKRLVAGGATSIQLAAYANTEVTQNYTISNSSDRAEFIANMEGKHPYTVEGDVVTVTYGPGSIYVASDNYVYAGDTAYVNLRQNSYLTGNSSLGVLDMNWYFSSDAAMSAGAVGSTGSFQTRPNSDFEILTYHEMCFIRAEVYMRMGDTNNAFKAYQEGIRAHMEMMQSKLQSWQAAGYTNPDMMPMDEEDINDYMASEAVCQSAGELTMSDIMLQKYVAMGCSVENWNDMRRFNFSAGNVGDFGVVYPGYDRGPLFAGQSQLTGSSPTDVNYWIRRWSLPPTLELSYNSTNALAMNPHAMDTDIWGYPVWWDCATDEEYYNYLK